MISREEAIEYFVYCLTELKMDTEAIRETYELAIEALSQPERPKGRWVGEVIHTEIGEEHAMQECSHCGKVRIIDNFCPNCGAGMVRGEEE